MKNAIRPCDNPFNAQRIDRLNYVEFDHSLDEVISRLERCGNRGAIFGAHGCGKSAMLDALGERLMAHGFAPLPLFINQEDAHRLPASWARTIARAKPTDALLLDGYDLLPIWARWWVRWRSRNAGIVLITTHRRTPGFETVAKPLPSPELLHRLIDQLAPEIRPWVDINNLYEVTGGNLRDALRLAYEEYASMASLARTRPASAA